MKNGGIDASESPVQNDEYLFEYEKFNCFDACKIILRYWRRNHKWSDLLDTEGDMKSTEYKIMLIIVLIFKLNIRFNLNKYLMLTPETDDDEV